MRISLHKPAAVLLGVAALAGVAAARPALGGRSARLQRLAVVASASGISDGATAHLDPGLTDVSLRNADTGEHALHVVRINDGVSVSEFQRALRTGDPAAAARLVAFYGGVNSVPPGQVWSMSVELRTGQYALVDSGQGADGAPNFLHPGFVQTFRVAGDAASVAPPTGTVDVRQVDFAFHLPARLPRDSTLKVVNAGAQPHEMDFLQLPPGVTPQRALQSLAHHQEPPGKEIDVLTAFSPGLTAWVPVHLQPGTYLVVSLFPDLAKGGLPQAAEGMVGSFTVS